MSKVGIPGVDIAWAAEDPTIAELLKLRTDPYEYADITSNTYYAWLLRRDFFREFPPRHPPASFSIDQIVKKLEEFLAAD